MVIGYVVKSDGQRVPLVPDGVYLIRNEICRAGVDCNSFRSLDGTFIYFAAPQHDKLFGCEVEGTVMEHNHDVSFDEVTYLGPVNVQPEHAVITINLRLEHPVTSITLNVGTDEDWQDLPQPVGGAAGPFRTKEAFTVDDAIEFFNNLEGNLDDDAPSSDDGTDVPF